MVTFARCRNATPQEPLTKWHPGLYIASTTTNNQSIWNKVGTGAGTEGIIQRFNADVDNKWRGAMLRFMWGKQRNSSGAIQPDDFLEDDTLGSYNAGMDRVQAYLDTISTFPDKYLILFIQIKTFGNFADATPLYMHNKSNPAYDDPDGFGNGQYNYASNIGGAGGFVPNIHVDAVRDRFIALTNEIATRFNDHPRFEALVINEASIVKPTGSGVWANKSVWYDKMTQCHSAMRTVFTKTQTVQWINADRIDMKPWVPDLRALGVGLGMPDLCKDDKGFNWRNDLPNSSDINPGNIQHCQASNGLVNIMGHMSQPTFDGTITERCQTSGAIQDQPYVYPAYPGPGILRQQVFDFAKNTVGCTHVVIAHNTSNQPITGEIDPKIPSTCAKHPWTALPEYSNRKYNVITDQWLNDPASDITPIMTRPTGW